MTAVSQSLARETQRVLDFDGPIEVIHNFFAPHAPSRSPEAVRRELGLGDELVVVHSSNLRPGKRVDVLLETVARIRPRRAFKLLVLAGEAFAPFAGEARRLGLGGAQGERADGQQVGKEFRQVVLGEEERDGLNLPVPPSTRQPVNPSTRQPALFVPQCVDGVEP